MSRVERQQVEVKENLKAAYERLGELQREHEKVEAVLSELQHERQQYSLLSDIVDYLDKLEKLGGAKLFWGDEVNNDDSRKLISRASDSLLVFDSKIQELTERRKRFKDELVEIHTTINHLKERSHDLEQVLEEMKYDFVIEREMEVQEFRPLIMPWTSQGEDEKRFRKVMAISLVVALLLGYLIPLWEIPLPPKEEVVEIPERLAKLILEKKPPPPPPEEKKLEELPKEAKKQQKKKTDATPQQKRVARKRAESAGLLAFKENFADLVDTSIDTKLGAKAQISSLGKTARRAERSIITSSATSGTGGISTASLSRDVGGAGKGLKGVGFSRVESSIGDDFFGGEDRPLSEGVGPSRTDEEIQIVFDRYKSALYRIYNRELRKNPALQGKMVLRITIGQDGSVTKASVESSDMDSPALNSKIIAKVKTFKFGKKDGVPTITILYPIDFLPAS